MRFPHRSSYVVTHGPHVARRHFGAPDPLTVDEWESVLRLATQWGFAGARDAALTELQKRAEPVRKLSLYAHPAYALPAEQWLLPAVRHLALRDTGPSVAEGQVLGMACVLQLCSVREKYAVACRGVKIKEYDQVLNEVIREVFKIAPEQLVIYAP